MKKQKTKNGGRKKRDTRQMRQDQKHCKQNPRAWKLTRRRTDEKKGFEKRRKTKNTNPKRRMDGRVKESETW